MSKILVTGGAGFIGSHLVDRLIGLGHSVVVVDSLISGNVSNLNSKAAFHDLRIEDPKLEEVFAAEKPEYVYHLAANVSVSASFSDPTNDAAINILGSINVFENCRKHGVNKIIISSSAAVYGEQEKLPVTEDAVLQPNTPYGISKLTMENYLQLYSKEYGLSFVILRYANVYGPRQTAGGEAGVIAVFIDKLLKGAVPVINGDGLATRDFVYVQDVVSANVAALGEGVSGIINVSSDTQTSIKDLFFNLRQLIGSPAVPTYGPARTEIRHSQLSNKRAQELLKLSQPIDLNVGLSQTVESFRSRENFTDIWIIVASWNVALRIGKVLKGLNTMTENIVVIDDCSSDETSLICNNHRCHLLRHPINFGQGAALQTGMEYALSRGAKVIVHFDGDGQMQIKDIPAVIAPIVRGEADVVFGSRFLKGGDNVPRSKKWFIHKPAIYLNYLLTGLKLTDAHCGFRALSNTAAEKCIIKQNRFAHATEILDLVHSHDLKFVEVPVDIVYHHYGQTFLNGLPILKDLLASKSFKQYQ